MVDSVSLYVAAPYTGFMEFHCFEMYYRSQRSRFGFPFRAQKHGLCPRCTRHRISNRFNGIIQLDFGSSIRRFMNTVQ